MIRAGKLPAAIYGILSGGAEFDVLGVISKENRVSVVKTLTPEQLAAVKNGAGVTQLYFRECNVNNKKQYVKYDGKAPYHKSANGGGAPNNEHGFPSQCHNGLLDDFKYEDKNKLNKHENFIAEVYAKSTQLQAQGEPGGWFRVGIVHLHKPLRVVELNVICTDTFILEGKSLFSHVMDFSLEFAKGNATPESESPDDLILVRYSSKFPYGTDAARLKWVTNGQYVTLEATTLASMTKYLHKGFRFAPLAAGKLFVPDPEDARQLLRNVGCNTNDKDTDLRTVQEYFALCLRAGQGQMRNFDNRFFTHELWDAMRALAQFTSDDATKDTIKRVQDAAPRDGDEFTEGAVIGDPHQRFTYALFALLTALTLLYADPQYVMNGGHNVENAEDLPALEERAMARANDIAALLREISEAITEAAKTALIRRMLDIARQLKTGNAIPMVKHNVAVAQ